jgi:segregation and condensation protein A
MTELQPQTLIDSSINIRIRDEWVSSIPDDLYIPPAAFEILLSQFEGPLDFLLYLIHKNGLDLRTLDIAPIASQYLQYIDKMQALDVELAADYLVMAALLADLKSRLLLPKPEAVNIEEDPRKTLIERLEIYARIKKGAAWLQQRPVLERDVFSTNTLAPVSQVIDDETRYDAEALKIAMQLLLARPKIQPHQIDVEEVQLDDKIAFVKQITAQQTIVSFEQLLLPRQGRMGIVVTFMAILELARQRSIIILSSGLDQALSIQGAHDD